MFNLSSDDNNSTDVLTLFELIEITLYTVHKINNYPKSFEKTVENYFHLLFPDEVKSYLIRRKVNERSFNRTGIGCSKSEDNIALAMPACAEQVRDIRSLCQLLVEQQEDVLRLISDELDRLEAVLSESSADKEGYLNDR